MTFTASTLADRVRAANGRPSGFDYMRLFLAGMVIVSHSIQVTWGNAAAFDLYRTSSFARIISEPVLPMFFALGGFLVTGSLDRCRSLVAFGGLRALRLFPALGVEITLSALIVGPLFTQMDLATYFSSHGFHSYFWNIVGFPHVVLPQVFMGNPVQTVVNVQLWTVPWDILGYIVQALFALVGLLRRSRLFLALAILSQVAILVWALIVQPPLQPLISGPMLVYCLIWGVVFYRFRDVVPHSLALCAVALALIALFSLLPIGHYLVAIPAAYATVVIGTLNPRRIRFFLSGDYSYGVYLYGYVLQQVTVALWPGTMVWYVNALITLVAAFAFAHLSWHAVELPALRLKGWVARIDAHILARLPTALVTVLTARPGRAWSTPMMLAERDYVTGTAAG